MNPTVLGERDHNTKEKIFKNLLEIVEMNYTACNLRELSIHLYFSHIHIYIKIYVM